MPWTVMSTRASSPNRSVDGVDDAGDVLVIHSRSDALFSDRFGF
jgi:hypothetical protein